MASLVLARHDNSATSKWILKFRAIVPSAKKWNDRVYYQRFNQKGDFPKKRSLFFKFYRIFYIKNGQTFVKTRLDDKSTKVDDIGVNEKECLNFWVVTQFK